jgi:hypothetical protein
MKTQSKLSQAIPKNIEQLILAQPINNIHWVHRDELNPNLYNPNQMAPPEMKLLIESIINDGWLFPICVLPKDVHIENLTENENLDKYTIIDGFHRYKTSGNPQVYKITEGYVPIVFPKGTDHIATTVRMNRVKGTHTVLGMADIVEMLIKDGKSIDYIMQQFGMESEEIYRLASRKGIPKTELITDAMWSTAWTPA